MQYWTKEMLVGGHPLLDFLNTVGDQDKDRTQNDLENWERFLDWAMLSDLYAKAERSKLRSMKDKDKQSEVLVALIEIRERIFEALQPLAANQPISDDAMSYLGSSIIDSFTRASLSTHASGHRWNAKSENPHWITDVVFLSLEDLLRNVDSKKIRECGRCSWLFINQGRGVGRKWCSMKTCGNRAKAEIHRMQ